jgi:hypothetical protein
MKKYILMILGLFCLLQHTMIFAAKVDSIYFSSTPVPSQSAEDRAKAEPQALGQVLVKVSGNTQLLDDPKIKDSLEKADSLMQEFSYSPSPGTPETPYLLRIRFDKAGVNRILRNVDVPTWGQNRPLTLAWIEYEVPNQPAVIIDSDSSSEIQNLFKTQAEHRGLPIILPMMDMQDLSLVNINDVVTMSLPVLQGASKRYKSDAILIARVFKNQNDFSIQAKMLTHGDQWEWTIHGKTLSDVTSTLMNNITDALAGRYATVVTNAVQSSVTLKITGVSQPNDFGDLMEYITHLTPVADVEPVRVMGDGVILKISLRGSKNTFIQALSAADKLQSVGSTEGDVLDYQWSP